MTIIQRYIPFRYQVTNGIIVDSCDNVSDNIDAIIFDRQYSPFIYKTNTTNYIPAESVYAVLEIKQKLNKKHIEYAVNKAKSVHKLKRTSVPIKHAGGEFKPVEPKKIISGLLCTYTEYNEKETRFTNTAMKHIIESGMDIVCVANHGVVEKSSCCSSVSLKETNLAAAYFIFRLIAMLQEKGTVPALDVMEYAKWALP